MKRNHIDFHNHTEDGYRYIYPNIQYKRIHGKAAIVCIGNGTESIGEFFTSGNYDFDINGTKTTFSIERVVAQETQVRHIDGLIEYRLHSWLPFNQINYLAYNQLEGVVNKAKMMESILTGNILSMLKSQGIIVEKHIDVCITAVLKEKLLKYKNVRFSSYDIDFKTNLLLPNYIGIGKSASNGFGLLTRKHNNN